MNVLLQMVHSKAFSMDSTLSYTQFSFHFLHLQAVLGKCAYALLLCAKSTSTKSKVLALVDFYCLVSEREKRERGRMMGGDRMIGRKWCNACHCGLCQ